MERENGTKIEVSAQKFIFRIVALIIRDVSAHSPIPWRIASTALAVMKFLFDFRPTTGVSPFATRGIFLLV